MMKLLIVTSRQDQPPTGIPSKPEMPFSINHFSNTQPQLNQHTIIDAFAGVGGLSLGASRAGFKVVAAIEKDCFAQRAHSKNFPTSKHYDNILQCSGAALLKDLELEEITGLIGGPPCQGFSTIGRREPSDSRNNLFLEFFRLVDELRPKFFVAENVPGILDPNYKNLVKRSGRMVAKSYRLLEPMSLRASDFGAPTSRRRIFFIGFRKDSLIQLHEGDFEPEECPPIFVADAFHGLRKKIPDGWNCSDLGWRKVRSYKDDGFGKRLRGHIPDGVGDPLSIERIATAGLVSGFIATKHTKEVEDRFRNTKMGGVDQTSKAPRLDWKKHCPTLRAGTASDRGSYQAVRPIHPSEPRVITPREAARLQGFPDWFQFDPTKWHSFRQIGNSVSPILAERVLEIISKSL